MARVLACCVAFVLFAGIASGALWYVPDDFATIQEALDSPSVVNGDIIAVRAGTYAENINFGGKAVTLISESGAESTIIDGSDNGSVVTFESNEGSTSVLQGFTITNGNGSFDYLFYAYTGGGIYCKDSAPTIEDCIITDNEADFGGGIFGGSPTLAGNEISNNSATWGGGLFCYEGRSVITENNFDGNVGYYGGGAYCHFKPDEFGVLLANTFASNSAFYGGGLYCFGSSSLILNNVMNQNTANTRGGGVFLLSGTATVTNNTIVGNSAGVAGGGISCRQGTAATVVNSIVFSNAAPTGPQLSIEANYVPASLAISFSDVSGGQAGAHVDPNCTLQWGAGMIDDNPLFFDAANGDFHITYPSPCRDAGYDTGSFPSTDPDGDPRNSLATTDIGVDEYYFHLFIDGNFVPGGNATFTVVGAPSQDVLLALGSGVRSKALNTNFGDLWLELPLLKEVPLGTIGSTGFLTFSTTVPASWVAGEERPFQALCGTIGETGTTLTNLEVMVIE